MVQWGLGKLIDYAGLKMHDHDCLLTAQCQTHVLDGTHAVLPLDE